jgi:hypothetical protein
LGYTFYSEIQTQLVSRTSSDDQGYFQLELPSGTYSLFVWEQERYYANGFDGFGYIMPVDVAEGAVVRRDMIIDYKAAY